MIEPTMVSGTTQVDVRAEVRARRGGCFLLLFAVPYLGAEYAWNKGLKPIGVETLGQGAALGRTVKALAVALPPHCRDTAKVCKMAIEGALVESGSMLKAGGQEFVRDLRSTGVTIVEGGELLTASIRPIAEELGAYAVSGAKTSYRAGEELLGTTAECAQTVFFIAILPIAQETGSYIKSGFYTAGRTAAALPPHLYDIARVCADTSEGVLVETGSMLKAGGAEFVRDLRSTGATLIEGAEILTDLAYPVVQELGVYVISGAQTTYRAGGELLSGIADVVETTFFVAVLPACQETGIYLESAFYTAGRTIEGAYDSSMLLLQLVAEPTHRLATEFFSYVSAGAATFGRGVIGAVEVGQEIAEVTADTTQQLLLEGGSYILSSIRTVTYLVQAVPEAITLASIPLHFIGDLFKECAIYGQSGVHTTGSLLLAGAVHTKELLVIGGHYPLEFLKEAVSYVPSAGRAIWHHSKEAATTLILVGELAGGNIKHLFKEFAGYIESGGVQALRISAAAPKTLDDSTLIIRAVARQAGEELLLYLQSGAHTAKTLAVSGTAKVQEGASLSAIFAYLTLLEFCSYGSSLHKTAGNLLEETGQATLDSLDVTGDFLYRLLSEFGSGTLAALHTTERSGKELLEGVYTSGEVSAHFTLLFLQEFFLYAKSGIATSGRVVLETMSGLAEAGEPIADTVDRLFIQELAGVYLKSGVVTGARAIGEVIKGSLELAHYPCMAAYWILQETGAYLCSGTKTTIALLEALPKVATDSVVPAVYFVADIAKESFGYLRSGTQTTVYLLKATPKVITDSVTPVGVLFANTAKETYGYLCSGANTTKTLFKATPKVIVDSTAPIAKLLEDAAQELALYLGSAFKALLNTAKGSVPHAKWMFELVVSLGSRFLMEFLSYFASMGRMAQNWKNEASHSSSTWDLFKLRMEIRRQDAKILWADFMGLLPPPRAIESVGLTSDS